jgi:hypothetical protein
MRKTKWYSVIQLVVIILSFMISSLLAFSHHEEDIDLEGYANFLKESLTQDGIFIAYDEANQIVDEAYGKAAELFQGNLGQCQEFVNMLINSYLESVNKDFIIIHNPEGWGFYSLEEADEDDQAKSLVDGITSTLESWNYSCVVLTFPRTQPGLSGMVGEINNTLSYFAREAEILAAGVEFLTQQLPETDIILVGISQGAAFGNEVMKLLPDTPQVYGIEAGLPFAYEPFCTERNFIINYNGTVPDALAQGDFWGLSAAYLSSPFKWLYSKIQGEETKRFGDYIQIPGHDYRWTYPRVSSQITDFLADKFAPN